MSSDRRKEIVCHLSTDDLDRLLVIDEDKALVFVLADRGSSERYVAPLKAAAESTIRLLLADRQQGSLRVYTEVFLAYEPLDEYNTVTHEYAVHGDGEHIDGGVHVNTYESHAPLA
jgi:transposase